MNQLSVALISLYVHVRSCSGMDSETTPIIPKKAPPMFSEPAQIQTVDTVEGLICTHEVDAVDVSPSNVVEVLSKL